MMIPMQLQKPEFRFIKIAPKSKIPIEKDWQNTNNYQYKDSELLTHLDNGGNYGVATGYGNLLGIDADNKKIIEIIENNFPETFTIKSRKGNHYYFICENAFNGVLENDHNNVGHIQFKGKQLIGANSTHETGTIYSVLKDTEIAYIDFNVVLMHLSKFIVREIKKEKEDKTIVETDEIIKQIKEKITLKDVMKYYGMDLSINPTKCLWHPSEKGKCFSYDNETYHCFHCLKSGNIFHLVMEQEKCSFAKAKRILMDLAKIEPKTKLEGKQFDKAINSFVDYLDMAKQFVKVQPLYFDEAKLWWFWNFKEFKWQMLDEVAIMNIVDEIVNVKGSFTPTTKSQIIECLKRIARLNEPLPTKETWIQFKDKIIDIETDEEIEPDQKYFVTNPIPWKIGETEDTPTINKLFTEWVEEGYVKSLYEMVAFCMIPTYFLHRIFCLVGSGRNGKSKYLGIIKNFIGHENCTSSELDIIIGSRFEGAKLYKKLVCMMGETNFSEIQKTSLLKKLTGEDLVGVEFKQKTPFDFVNYAKIFIATNTLPVTRDKTLGYYSRWFIVDFPNKFPETRDVLKEIPKVEYENLAKKCVIILKNLWIKRRFAEEGDYEERVKKYEEKSNPLAMFIKEKCFINVNEKMPFWAFYDEFKLFLEQRGYRIQSKKEVGMNLDDEGYETRRDNVTTEDGKYTSWHYIDGLRHKQYFEKRVDGRTIVKWIKSESIPINTDNTVGVLSPSHKRTKLGVGIIGNMGIEEEQVIYENKSQDKSNYEKLYNFIVDQSNLSDLLDLQWLCDYAESKLKIQPIDFELLIQRGLKEGLWFEPKSGFIKLI